MSPEPLGATVRAFHPGLTDGAYELTSPRDAAYNCIAHAIGDTSTWWAPGGFPGSDWPSEIDQSESIEAWVHFFTLHGFAETATPETDHSIEKLAIYAIAGEATHVAVQLADGRWSSKLGSLQDIAHSLDALRDNRYGDVAVYLARPRRVSTL